MNPDDETGGDWLRTGGAFAGGLASRLASRLDGLSIGDRLGRIRIVERLGEGGMGSVYEGFDEKLERPVAVKAIHGRLRGNPEALTRFQHEARILSRLNHPAICQIYEVLEHQGSEYLVLELVRGETLRESADRLVFEQKLRLVERIARALAVAHAEGIVHRDLKPDNLMVTTGVAGDGGEVGVKILDFGIARLDRPVEEPLQATDASATAAPSAVGTRIGSALGTAAYMSPEQARGDAVTTASDLFSLGLILQELVSQTPPHPRRLTPQQVLHRVGLGHVDPPTDVSAELGELLARLRSPDPAARPSAEELANRLEGILREPLRRRRQRLRLGVAAAVATLVLAAAGVAFHTRWQAGQRLALAQRYGQKVERMSWLLRTAELLPTHPLDREKELVAKVTADIEAERSTIAAWGRGPSLYATGSVALLRGDVERAERELGESWQLGYRDPEVALAFGTALALRYRDELESLLAIGEREERLRRRREIERQYRDRIAPILRAAQGAEGSSPKLVAARLALVEGRFEAAIELAGEAGRELPWLIDSRLIEAEAWRELGSRRRDRGESEAAEEAYDRAVALLRRGAEVAPSSARLRSDLCAVAGEMVESRLYGRGGDPTPILDWGAAACTEALAIDRDHDEAELRLAQIERLRGLSVGEEPWQAYDRAEAALARVLARDPHHWRALSSLGMVLADRGRDEEGRGLASESTLQRAIEALETALESRPESIILHGNLGLALVRRGNALANRGEDPTGDYERAVKELDRAIELAPEEPSHYNNRGRVFQARSHWEKDHGLDPRPSYHQAIASFQGALRINPQSTLALNNLGVSAMDAGHWTFSRGEDPTDDLEQAIASFEATLELNPGYAAAYNNIGMSLLRLALWDFEQGRDPTPRVDRARAPLARASELAPRAFQPPTNLARHESVRARHLLREGADPGAALETARRAYHRALELNPRYAQAHVELADGWLIGAQAALSRGADPDHELASADAEARRALALDPSKSEAEQILARGALLAARCASSPEVARSRLADVSLHLERSLELNGNDAATYAVKAEQLLLAAALDGADGRVDDQEIERALARGLELRPGDPALLALRRRVEGGG